MSKLKSPAPLCLNFQYGVTQSKGMHGRHDHSIYPAPMGIQEADKFGLYRSWKSFYKMVAILEE